MADDESAKEKMSHASRILPSSQVCIFIEDWLYASSRFHQKGVAPEACLSREER
jgi:hypothetical protein